LRGKRGSYAENGRDIGGRQAPPVKRRKMRRPKGKKKSVQPGKGRRTAWAGREGGENRLFYVAAQKRERASRKKRGRVVGRKKGEQGCSEGILQSIVDPFQP